MERRVGAGRRVSDTLSNLSFLDRRQLTSLLSANESRVARIKARVAELTGNMESARQS